MWRRVSYEYLRAAAWQATHVACNPEGACGVYGRVVVRPFQGTLILTLALYLTLPFVAGM